jgi:hypothetical protein
MGDQHNEYLFEVELLAAGCVRAASESDAREVTPAVLGAPGSDVVRPAD